MPMRDRVLGVVAAVIMVASCGQPAALPAELGVTGAWVRLAAVPGRPAAGYFTLHGGAADATLIRVTTPAANGAEMHESMAGGMKAIGSVPVPAAGAVRFAPAGRHVMLFDLDPRLTPGKTVPLVLGFADGRQLRTDARIAAAGDPAPVGG